MDASSFKVSVHRRKENVYLKVNGDYGPDNMGELMQALERIITASAKFSQPGAGTSFTFTTCSQVSPERMVAVGRERSKVELSPAPKADEVTMRNMWRRKQVGTGAPSPSSSPVWRRLCSIIF